MVIVIVNIVSITTKVRKLQCPNIFQSQASLWQTKDEAMPKCLNNTILISYMTKHGW
jgi:hypothetical protein